MVTWAGTAAADLGYLVRDLTQDADPYGSSSPAESVALDGIAYFTAEDHVHGRGLWRTDGTTAGTYAVAPLPSVQRLAVSRRSIWFANGFEVWCSDGTPVGTVHVRTFSASLGPVRETTAPQQFTAGPGGTYFTADDGTHGVELWVSDGSPAGTRMVADLDPGFDSSFPEALRFGHGFLYFIADGPTGRDLWRTDGTTAGTRRLRDVGPGTVPNLVPAPSIEVLGDLLVFAADDGMHGLEPWISDGTAGGTRLLADTVSGPVGGLRFASDRLADVSPFFRVNEAVVFFTGGSPGRVWRTTGTAAGTRSLGEGQPPRGAAVVVGDRLFYVASGPRISVVSDSTVLNQTPGGRQVDRIEAPLNGGDAAYFLIADDDRCELWRSDGSAEGLQRIVSGDVCGEDRYHGDGWTARAGDRILFSGGVGEVEPYVTDDTPSGAHRLRDINAAAGRTLSTIMAPEPAHAVGDVILFTTIQNSGYMLWRSDGTAHATFPLLRMSVVTGASIGGQFVFLGARFEDQGLWVSDTTPEGTAMLARLHGLVRGVATPEALFAIAEEDGIATVWRSDGTHGGTAAVATLPSQQFDTLTPYAGGLAFVTRGDAVAQEVWWLPPGAAEPRRLGAFGYSPPIDEMVEGYGALYMVADAGTGVQLWRADVRADSATPVTDLPYRYAARAPLRDLTAWGRGILVAFTDDTPAIAPWLYDGASLRQLADIRLPGTPFEPFPRRFAALGDTALFAGRHGAGLWRTDGTAAGTAPAWDPGQLALGGLGPLSVLDGVAVFSAESGLGAELWRTDGTAGGTYPIADAAPGRASSGASLLAATDRHIFYAADDRFHGTELWALPRSALAAHCIGDCDQDGAVTIDDLIRGVSLALEGGSGCLAFDRDGDGTTSIAELVRAVGAAQGGCV